MDQRFPREETGVIDQKLRREIIDSIDDDIIVAEDFECVSGCEPFFVHRHGDVGVQRLDLFFAREDLGATHIRSMVKDLALEIGQVHYIAVDQPNGADSCSGQIQCRRGTEATGADEKNPGFGDFFLPLAADFRQQDMPAVAVNLFFSKFHLNQRCQERSKWVSNEAVGKRKPEAYPRGYVEDFLEPRTKLEAIFSVLIC